MSWYAYVDSLTKNENISKATIIGLNGAIWTPAGAAEDKGQVLEISQAEASAIGGAMSAKSYPAVQNHFSQTGVTINGVKYMFLRDLDEDGRIMTAKKVKTGNLTMVSTKQAIVIIFIPDGAAVGAANIAVMDTAKYLEGQNY